MRLGCKVYYDLALADQFLNDIPMRYIAVKKTKPSISFHFRKQIIQIACIGEGVKQNDFVLRIFFEDVIDKVTTYKTGTAGYQNGFFSRSHLLMGGRG